MSEQPDEPLTREAGDEPDAPPAAPPIEPEPEAPAEPADEPLTGVEPGADTEPKVPEGMLLCELCGGAGVIPDDVKPDPHNTTCDVCDGRGVVYTGSRVDGQAVLACVACQGNGWAPRTRANAPAPAAAPAPALDLPAGFHHEWIEGRQVLVPDNAPPAALPSYG